MKTLFHIRNLLFLFACFAMLGGCSQIQQLDLSKFKEPTLEYKDYKITDVNEKQVSIDVIFKAKNPNDFEISKFKADYELFVKEKSFIKGKGVAIELIPKGESEVVVPVVIVYENLFKTITSIAEQIISGKKELPISADVSVYGKYTVVKIADREIEMDFKFNKKIDMNVPIPDTKDLLKGGIKNKIKDIFK